MRDMYKRIGNKSGDRSQAVELATTRAKSQSLEMKEANPQRLIPMNHGEINMNRDRQHAYPSQPVKPRSGGLN